MRVFLIICFLSSMAFGNERIRYANIYADQLIRQFDKELELGFLPFELYKSETYLKILAARDYIEHKGSHEAVTPLNAIKMIEVADNDLFHQVKSEINSNAKQLEYYQNQVQKTVSLIIYPSMGRDGNLTGNTFPKNVWSLTFDDGPHKTRTAEVLRNLHIANMKASFFVLMREANKYPTAIDEIIADDMELALHSYNHLNLVKQDQATVEYEIVESKKELEETFHNPIKIFRLPYGSGMRNQNIRKVIAKEKMVHIFWNVDTLDWKDKNPKSIFARTKKLMELTPNKSGIILFHDIHAQTVVASQLVMEYLNQESKTVCKVGEVINYLNQLPQDCLK